jgi:hypothetical protein
MKKCVHFLQNTNAKAHLLPEAGATQERTLEAVRCSAWFGGRSHQQSSPGAHTEA